jgi:hypothetical protein
MLDKYGAETQSAKAEARRRAAEAVEAENQAMISTRRDLLAIAARRTAIAEASKAEAEARKAHAEADILEAAAQIVKSHITSPPTTKSVAEAGEALKVALRRLNQKGGGLFVDTDALNRLFGENTERHRALRR